MKLSYWEEEAWFDQVDFTLVGSGLVGLNAALRLRERFPHKRILVVEKGSLPSGASTRNAGFACFGSLSELLADLHHHSPEEIHTLVLKRYEGIQYLRQLLGDLNIRYQNKGGHELFLEAHQDLFEACHSRMPEINQLLRDIFGSSPFRLHKTAPSFRGLLPHQFTHQFEGELHPGHMMQALLEKANKAGIWVLNGLTIDRFEESASGVQLFAGHKSWRTDQLLIATNGFASGLLPELEVAPARAQVVLTSSLQSRIEGCYHLDRGYYYFRWLGDRLLFGGGREQDIKGETTTEAGTSEVIQNRLEKLLREVILPGQDFHIEKRWSGVMGVGPKKAPIVQQISGRVYCGVRLGGMGVALGSLVGRELADLI